MDERLPDESTGRKGARGGRSDSGPRIERPEYDERTEWACCLVACGKRGPLREGRHVGVRFLRHTCRGHGATLNRDAPAVLLDACSEHADEFQRIHGLAGEPDWIRRSRIKDDPAGPGGAPGKPTVISSQVGSGT